MKTIATVKDSSAAPATYVLTLQNKLCACLHTQTHSVQNGAVAVASLKQWELQSVSQLAWGRRYLPTVTGGQTGRSGQMEGEAWKDAEGASRTQTDVRQQNPSLTSNTNFRISRKFHQQTRVWWKQFSSHIQTPLQPGINIWSLIGYIMWIYSWY